MWFGSVKFVVAFAMAIGISNALAETPSTPESRVVRVDKVWDKSAHNGFTDLIRFKDQWYLTFREGSKHVSDDGSVRVLRSDNGDTWESVASFASDTQDMRECKFSVTPDGRLMLMGAAHNLREHNPPNHYSYAWFTEDGTTWTERVQVAEPNFWLWRAVWHEGTAYSFGYATVPPYFVRLFTSTDGVNWTTAVESVFDQDFPNENQPLFLKDGTLLLLLRRDQGSTTAQLGVSRAPYDKWEWKDLGQRIGSPNLLQLTDGRILAPVRLLNPMRTSLCWLDIENGALVEFCKLPSGGDGGYPAGVVHDGQLWVSYYSSHEDRKSSIYLARIEISGLD